jgi:hypothetical protein
MLQIKNALIGHFPQISTASLIFYDFVFTIRPLNKIPARQLQSENPVQS